MGNIFTIMRTILKPNPEEFFTTRPVFTLSEFADYYGKNRLADASNILKYHRRKGRIVNIAREIYAVIPYGSDVDKFEPDRSLVAAAARDDAVLCYHAALELLGFSHSIWNTCTVFSSRRRSSIDLRSASIHFLCIPTPLRDTPNLGTETIYRMNTSLVVTGKERTLVEGFRKPHHAGGLEEHVESVSGFGVLDLDLLKKILELYDQKNLWAAAGWFLSWNMERFGISDEYLREFEQHKPVNPQYLPGTYQNGILNNRWNIIFPDNLNESFEGHAT